MILTLLLMFVALSVATGAKERGLLAGVAVGGVVALESLFAGPVCGASMNPARSLAPAVVSGHLEHLWVYLVAPTLGACLAVCVCGCVHDAGCCARAKSGVPTVTESTPKKRVLFVCVENSNRSQMAEAFAHIHGAGRVEAGSARVALPRVGSTPAPIAFMKERGYDLSTHGSKSLDQFNGQDIDVAVTMGCGDECPLVRAREEWNIPDPKEMPPEQYREVRNLIETKVKELLATL